MRNYYQCVVSRKTALVADSSHEISEHFGVVQKPKNMQQDLNDLMYFAHVVDHGGFAPASRALGEPKSKLSRRIASLEVRLGVRLLHRSTRHFSVTDIGANYYRHCKAMLLSAKAAQEEVEQVFSEPCGVIRVCCPIALLHSRVTSIVVEFMSLNPKVEVHLKGINRPVDLVAEGYDIAIRARTPPLEDSSLAMRKLAQRDWCLVASPSFCQRFPMPTVPADLVDMPSLSDDRDHKWHLIGPGGVTALIAHRPRFVTDDMYSLRAAAIAGMGVVHLPLMILEEELERGELVRLLPEWSSKGALIHAVFPTRRGLQPAVRKFLDFLVERFDKDSAAPRQCS